jgi:hypothetical protein
VLEFEILNKACTNLKTLLPSLSGIFNSSEILFVTEQVEEPPIIYTVSGQVIKENNKIFIFVLYFDFHEIMLL